MQLPDAKDEPTISVEQSADVLGISRASAYQAAKRGEIPTLRFGRRVRVPTALLAAMLGQSQDADHAA